MKISVIVPAYNEERLLGSSLKCMRDAMTEFVKRGWACELIVCDNNSTDRTADISRAASARVVFEPLNQISRARNAGARNAGGDWLVFVDADSCPSAGLFADTAQAIESGRYLAGGSTVAFAQAELAPALVLVAWNRLSRLTRWAAGSFMFCEAAAFHDAGGFNESLYASEEIDLFRRLKRLARSAGRGVVILHRHPILTSDRKARLYGWDEMGLFLLKTIVRRGRTLRSREACYAWYDGRR